MVKTILTYILNQITYISREKTYILLGLTCIILVTSCETDDWFTDPVSPHVPELELRMNLPKENGEYVYQYPLGQPSSYTFVFYETDQFERVFWDSDDYFIVYHWGIPYSYPIVNYSTYSDGGGYGRQLVYIYEDHIGDTLDVTGCISDNICRDIRFLVK